MKGGARFIKPLKIAGLSYFELEQIHIWENTIFYRFLLFFYQFQIASSTKSEIYIPDISSGLINRALPLIPLVKVFNTLRHA